MANDNDVLSAFPDQIPITRPRVPVVGDRVVAKGLIGILRVTRIGPDNLCDLEWEATKEERLAVPSAHLTYLFKP